MRSRDARVIPPSAAKIASSHRRLCAKRGKPDTLIPPPPPVLSRAKKREERENTERGSLIAHFVPGFAGGSFFHFYPVQIFLLPVFSVRAPGSFSIYSESSLLAQCSRR